MMKVNCADTEKHILVQCPGESFKALRKIKTSNPVIILDEIDKVEVITAATQAVHCWKYWIRSKTILFTIIILSWNMT